MYQLLIQGGTVVDGSGSKGYAADIAVQDGRIVAIAQPGTIKPDQARETLDATDQLVTPGFIDPHTHYDGQATWDSLLSPSANHGVTTAIMGNCGVGFAPVKAHEQQYLIELMEGVEDIPGSALTEGIQWSWEKFPEYLDALERKHRAIDIAAQLPHGPLRLYVLGQDSDVNAPATPAQIKAMAEITEEAIAAGAVAFSSNRIPMHTSIRGESVPGTFAEHDEVLSILQAAKRSGCNLMQAVPLGLMGESPDGFRNEVELYRKLSIETGSTIFFTMAQNNVQPDLWMELLDSVDKANAAGAQLKVATANRPGGILMSWDTFNIFMDRPSYVELMQLPRAERLKELRNPARRARILAEEAQTAQIRSGTMVVMYSLNSTYLLTGDQLMLEPDPEHSIGKMIERSGQPAEAVLYDTLCELSESGPNGTTGFLHIYMGNYAKGSLDAVYDMMTHPDVLIGAADGGAHVNVICDASYPSFMLQHWVRDRTRGPKLPLESAVRKMTSDVATLYGFDDRGLIATGKRADLNIIDLQALRMHAPRVVRDLPTGAPRLLQDVDGFRATIANGEVTFRNGVYTGALPGRLLRHRMA